MVSPGQAWTWDPGLWTVAQQRLALLGLGALMATLMGLIALPHQVDRGRVPATPESVAALAPAAPSMPSTPSMRSAETEPQPLQAHEVLQVVSTLAADRAVTVRALRPAAEAGFVNVETHGPLEALIALLRDLAVHIDPVPAVRLELEALPIPHQERDASNAPRMHRMRLLLRGWRSTGGPAGALEPTPSLTDAWQSATDASESGRNGRDLFGDLPASSPTSSAGSPTVPIATIAPVALSVPLSELRLVGTLRSDGTPRALVRVGRLVHPVAVGDAIGSPAQVVSVIDDKGLQLGSRRLDLQLQSTAPGRPASIGSKPRDLGASKVTAARKPPEAVDAVPGDDEQEDPS